MGDNLVKAVDGVNLDVFEGEYLIIMGPSGSGKSTLMHLMGCLDRPDSGELYIGNVAVSKLSDAQLAKIRNKMIGFVFQQFNLLPRLTAIENVELPMIYAQVPRAIRRKRAKELLKMVGLSERMSHKPTQLSGGQMQRVAIARALANDPQIILADEPTGNLDTKSGEEILKIFSDLHSQGLTIVVVTHDPEVAEQGDRIINMRDGKIVSQEVRASVGNA
ncbi:MAG: putative transport system ATP-binding protein [Pseudothermotoga sp.]|jgi:putative ABC transport system ATP-binding protein|nr:MAG: ABC transporter related [Pseudothermotoga lettingae]MDI3495115.1 putative transport system ATP-binding protein [Pseudothermotoga sp.]MDK2884456.1 putative transport system ATP-binding protein [Pseudothermotoga sp.]HBJ81764.1 ABC transporter ATP-binding protein [Pseudothermotoga sp.]HBT26293.1 ABC transporter ATP-binding protein [Pseudothermotoga sp.]